MPDQHSRQLQPAPGAVVDPNFNEGAPVDSRVLLHIQYLSEANARVRAAARELLCLHEGGRFAHERGTACTYALQSGGCALESGLSGALRGRDAAIRQI